MIQLTHVFPTPIFPSILFPGESISEWPLWDLLPRPFPYLGSAHQVFNIHVLRSCASSIFTSLSFMSFLITSLHLSFGLPIFRCPPISIFHVINHYYSFFSLPLHMSMTNSNRMRPNQELLSTFNFSSNSVCLSRRCIFGFCLGTGPGTCRSAAEGHVWRNVQRYQGQHEAQLRLSDS